MQRTYLLTLREQITNHTRYVDIKDSKGFYIALPCLSKSEKELNAPCQRCHGETPNKAAFDLK